MNDADLRAISLTPEAPITDAVESLEVHRAKMVLVTDEDMHLLGTITDGDIRRALIRGIPLSEPCKAVMNRHPTVAAEHADPEQVLGLMRVNEFRQLPVIDEEGRVVDLRLLTEFQRDAEKLPNPVVLMAGGLGTRLRPLTDDRPKPLINVGPRPILETVIDGFAVRGFHQFFISVNYMGDMISDHFGDGSRFGVSIDYLRESSALGTAGSLSLLPERPEHPVLVSNADLLTKVNYLDMLDLHREESAEITMGVRAHEVDIPFGVVDLDHDRVTQLTEKPNYTFFVNAGIYVLNPSVLDRITPDEPLHMTDLVDQLLAEGARVAAFPIREFWLDIGRMDDLHRAEAAFKVQFDD